MLRAVLFLLTYLVIDHFQLSLAVDNLPYDMHADPCGIRPDMNFAAPCRCGDSCTNRLSWNGQYSDLVNVAYNRPVTSSAVQECEADEISCYGCNKTTPACATVNFNYNNPDRLSSGCDFTRTNCVQLAGLRWTGWWSVDLQRPYTIRLVMIKPRVGFNQTTYNATIVQARRFANIIVIVDGHTCYQFPSYRDSSTIQVPDVFHYLTCESAVTGQFLKLQKQRTYHSDRVDDKDEYISFCELWIWVCPSGKFGGSSYSTVGLKWDTKAPFTCTNCPATCSYFCDNHDGCLSGTMDQLKQRSQNVAMYKTWESYQRPYFESNGLGVYSGDHAVDGLKVPINQLWFQTWRSWDHEAFYRVTFGNLYIVTGAAVYVTQALEQQVTDCEVRVARGLTTNEIKHTRKTNKDKSCWLASGKIGTGVDRQCTSCSTGVVNCPRAEHAAITEAHGLHLYIVEFMVFGLPVKETGLQSTCPSPCKLTFCQEHLICESNKCKAPIGETCTSDDDCVIIGKCEGGKCRLRLNTNCKDFTNPDLCARGLECATNQDNKCKIPVGEGPCGVTDDCLEKKVSGNNVISCDTLSICRIRSSATCSRDDECAAGAKCSSNACACDTVTSTLVGQTCKPKLFEKGCTNDTECTGANYECRNSKCVCKTSYTLVHRDFSCKVAAGGSCSSSTCGEGLVCESNLCRIKLGDVCEVANSEECQMKTVCDDKQIRCLTPVGETCTEDRQCVSGTTCKDKSGLKCLFVPGNVCNTTALCQPGFACAKKETTDADNKCLVALGSMCDPKDNLLQCALGQICDSNRLNQMHCRKPIFESCSNTNECQENAICSDQKCYWDASAKCNNSLSPDPCGPNRTCAEDGVCRINIGKACKTFPGFCVIGASCNISANACECSAISEYNTTSGKCILKVPPGGEVPSLWNTICTQPRINASGWATSLPCKEAVNAWCDPDTSTCRCNTGFLPNVDFVCKPDLGGACIKPNTTDAKILSKLCSNGGVCDDGLCKIPVGQPCLGKNKGNCVSGTLCAVNGVCKLTVGLSCQGDLQQLCFDGLVCDASNNCKSPQNDDCVLDSFCTAGSKCVNNTCKCNPDVAKTPTASDCGGSKDGYIFGVCQGEVCLDKNAHCAFHAVLTKSCTCTSQYEASPDLTCKLALGQPCSAVDDCAVGKVCDKDKKVCKAAVGTACDRDKQEVCETGTECIDGTCRLPLLAPCDEETKYNCPIDAKCDDVVSQCKRPLGSECGIEAQNQCETGSICTKPKPRDTKYVCACHPKTKEKSGICAPKAGEAKGECQLGDNCAEGAYCVKDKNPKLCTCEADHKFIPDDYTCEAPKGGKRTEKDGVEKVTSIFTIILGSLLLIGVIVAAVFWAKGSLKRHALQDEMASRIANLTTLGSKSVLKQKEIQEQQSKAGNAPQARGPRQADDEFGSTIDPPEFSSVASEAESSAIESNVESEVQSEVGD